MKKIIVVIPVNDAHKALLESSLEAEFIYTTPAEVTKEQLEEANVIIGNVPPAKVAQAKQLELMQLNSAGTDGYTAEGILPEGCHLCNATGAYGLAISEHMLGMVLTLMKRLDQYRDNMHTHEWTDRGGVNSIYGSTTVVLGMGDIGGEFAMRMNALGSKVIGIRRTPGEKPEYCETVDTIENLDQYLGKADIVAMSLPGTPATYHIIDQERLSKFKKGAILVNVGRGTAIDQEALAEALNNGTLYGAGIDVTDPEPLPSDSPLWEAPRLLITPHVSGGFHLQETFERIVRISAENLKHLDNQEPMRNEVDFATGYRKR